MRFLLTSCVLLASVMGVAKAAEPLEAVQLYSQDELVKLIRKNTHLKRVKDDDCQLVQDIAARASKMQLPTYQFLYGDMLAYNVCVERDVELGVYYMRQAAKQGLAEALEQLGRYYDIGRLVQADKGMAIIYLREAAAQGNVPAQMRLVKLYNQGHGSPQDYEDAYRWLFHASVADRAQHNKIARQLALLAKKMPDSVVARARLPVDN
ncbi:tetratricopeptide repeat protein [Pseudoalteromonas sp. T1lg75]|uniref:tetratricopeptide repeat protein n=1 Tax=Pseudoalteromonas sp. T1lg75 TaxID=2077102 RepID=UPI000CF6D0FC|nr:tetratricopeptide repeat protein [Pseudoalteromonas sp. T1lg75]